LLPGCTPRRQCAGGVLAPPKTGITAVGVDALGDPFHRSEGNLRHPSDDVRRGRISAIENGIKKFRGRPKANRGMLKQESDAVCSTMQNQKFLPVFGLRRS